MQIDLGCGKETHEERIGLDVRRFDDVDVVCDLENGLPFDDDSVETVHAYSVLEHIDNLRLLMSEIHRVLTPGGHLVGKVPHYSDPQAYNDPTHKRFFGLKTFDFWVPSTKNGEMGYFDARFKKVYVKRTKRILFWRGRPVLFKLKAIK